MPGAYENHFNPRSPRGERRHTLVLSRTRVPHFNPRSPRGERLRNTRAAGTAFSISIHAPRGGSDKSEIRITACRNQNFNPRSPRGERLPCYSPMIGWRKFQSTLPAGGATNTGAYSLTGNQDFNPRSPRGERRTHLSAGAGENLISIHAPRGGSDQVRYHKVE